MSDLATCCSRRALTREGTNFVHLFSGVCCEMVTPSEGVKMATPPVPAVCSPVCVCWSVAVPSAGVPDAQAARPSDMPMHAARAVSRRAMSLPREAMFHPSCVAVDSASRF